MVKNFSGLNRMKSTPALRNDIIDINSPPQLEYTFPVQASMQSSSSSSSSPPPMPPMPTTLPTESGWKRRDTTPTGYWKGVIQQRNVPSPAPAPAPAPAAATAPASAVSEQQQEEHQRQQLMQQFRELQQLQKELQREREALQQQKAHFYGIGSGSGSSVSWSTDYTTAGSSSIPPPMTMSSKDNAAIYTKPFCDFLTDNPTVFHATAAFGAQLDKAGYSKLSERDEWKLEAGGKYYVVRNGSSLIAFVVGGKYEAGNGAAILAGHIDALTAKLKPVSEVPNKAGYVQLGVAPYAGGLGNTWWDRDLSIGGRVLVKEGGKIVTKLVKLGWPIAKIPTLAEHFGAPAQPPFNKETQMVPIIGLQSSSSSNSSSVEEQRIAPEGSFAATQPPRLVRAIANELGLGEKQYGDIYQWELELYDTQPAGLLGLDKEFITAGRIDDKLCSWAAFVALLNSGSYNTQNSGIIKCAALFDDEEIGSGLRQGARGNFLVSVMERAVGSLAPNHEGKSGELLGRTFANSFLVSSDVTHAVNPNFESVYLAKHAPELNKGIVVSADSNGHMTTDAISTAIFSRCAERVGANLQVFSIRNDSRSGGTVGPMLSCATGMRSIDAGCCQLSMHSIRATTGALDPGLGVICFEGFLNGFEDVDKEFRESE